MVQIDNLTDAADQVSTLQMPDGSVGTLELIFLASCSLWMFNFTHPQFPNGADNGQMLCQHPNILRNFKNVLDFGMACESVNGNNPVSVEDFANGNITLYILDASDVAAVEADIFGINT
jgi:hypothetical protein